MCQGSKTTEWRKAKNGTKTTHRHTHARTHTHKTLGFRMTPLCSTTRVTLRPQSSLLVAATARPHPRWWWWRRPSSSSCWCRGRMTPALISGAPLPPYPNLVSGAPRKHLPSLLDLVSFSFHSTELSKSASNHIKLGNARQRFVSTRQKRREPVRIQSALKSQATASVYTHPQPNPTTLRPRRLPAHW